MYHSVGTLSQSHNFNLTIERVCKKNSLTKKEVESEEEFTLNFTGYDISPFFSFQKVFTNVDMTKLWDRASRLKIARELHMTRTVSTRRYMVAQPIGHISAPRLFWLTRTQACFLIWENHTTHRHETRPMPDRKGIRRLFARRQRLVA